jgi:hypothetical protein
VPATLGAAPWSVKYFALRSYKERFHGQTCAGRSFGRIGKNIQYTKRINALRANWVAIRRFAMGAQRRVYWQQSHYSKRLFAPLGNVAR